MNPANLTIRPHNTIFNFQRGCAAREPGEGTPELAHDLRPG
jgi:hypothetical protein